MFYRQTFAFWLSHLSFFVKVWYNGFYYGTLNYVTYCDVMEAASSKSSVQKPISVKNVICWRLSRFFIRNITLFVGTRGTTASKSAFAVIQFDQCFRINRYYEAYL